MLDRLLIVDDEIGMRAALDASLRHAGWLVETACGVEEGFRKFEAGRHALVLTDMRMRDGDGLQLMQKVKSAQPGTPVILLTAYGTVPEAVQAVKAGACDYLVKPVSTKHLNDRIAKLIRSAKGLSADTPFIGRSPALLNALDDARMAARTSADILVEAESGTGKELLARYIHQHSRNHDGPFVAVNCAAVPEALLESELFGHARGAFTGATNSKKGKFVAAHGGTLLLDEIGEMPLFLQPKLLRVLQERKVEPLGTNQVVPVDVRVIATTNRSLATLVREGTFRADLYFRLNVIPLTLPPLRDRGDDISELALHFAKTLSEDSQHLELTPEFLGALHEHSWPGNVRELANAVMRVLTFSKGKKLGAQSLHVGIRDFTPGFKPVTASVTRNEADRRLFHDALAVNNGNRTRTAKALGVSVRTVRNKINRYGLVQEMPA